VLVTVPFLCSIVTTGRARPVAASVTKRLRESPELVGPAGPWGRVGSLEIRAGKHHQGQGQQLASRAWREWFSQIHWIENS